MLPNPFEKFESRRDPGPSTLDDWCDRNARELERHDSDGGVRNIGYALLVVTALVFGTLYWGLGYL